MKKFKINMLMNLRKIGNKNNKNAFTLIEMLIVLVVVALLMAIIIPNIAGQRDRINVQASQNIAEIITNQVDTYELIEGDSDVSLDTLLDGDYITSRQLTEAVKLLDLTSSEVITLPIVSTTP